MYLTAPPSLLCDKQTRYNSNASQQHIKFMRSLPTILSVKIHWVTIKEHWAVYLSVNIAFSPGNCSPGKNCKSEKLIFVFYNYSNFYINKSHCTKVLSVTLFTLLTMHSVMRLITITRYCNPKLLDLETILTKLRICASCIIVVIGTKRE